MRLLVASVSFLLNTVNNSVAHSGLSNSRNRMTMAISFSCSNFFPISNHDVAIPFICQFPTEEGKGNVLEGKGMEKSKDILSVWTCSIHFPNFFLIC